MRFKGSQDDTGFITLPSIVTGSWGIQYRVRNGEITVWVDGAATIPNSATATTISSSALPSELRPPTNARAGGYFGGFPGLITVTPAGDVQAVQQSGASRGSVSGVIKYPLS